MLGFKVLVFLGVASGVFGGLVQQQLVKQVVQQPEPFDAYPQYNYGYSIQDPLTGDSKRQEETREGDVVKGQYSLVEPDGSLRTVTYTADVNGFNAVVTRTNGYAPAQVYSRVPFVASTPVQHFRPQVVFQPSRPLLQPLRPVQVHPVQQPIHFRPQPIQVQPVHPIHVQPQPVQPIQVQPVQPVQPTYPQPPSDAEIVEQPQQPQQPQPVRPPPQQPQPIQPQPIQPQPQPIQPQPQPQPIRPPPQPVQPQPTFPQGPPEEAQSDDAVIVDNPVARRADAGAGQQTNGGQSSFSVRSSRDGQYNFNFGF